MLALVIIKRSVVTNADVVGEGEGEGGLQDGSTANRSQVEAHVGQRQSVIRGIAAGLLACACLASPPHAIAQHALDMRPLAECLKGWDIQWRMPYYPQLFLNKCTEEGPTGKALIANAPERRMKAAMNFSTDAFPLSPGESRPYGDAPQALYAHFDRLLAGQGFKRVEGPVMGTGETPIPKSAAYERERGNSTLRVELSMLYSHTFDLVLEARGQLQDAAKLPAPKADFDITRADEYAPLFVLPGAKLVSEGIVWEQQDFPDRPGSASTVQVYVPARQFRYEIAAKLTQSDALSAWQIALRQAGWTPANTPYYWSGTTRTLNFKLPGRTLEAGLSAFEDQGVTRLTAVLIDPGFWPSVVPSLRQMEWTKPWEFAPEFDATGNPTEATRRKLFALSGWTHNTGPEKLYIVPVVAERLLADKVAVERARKAAQWMHDEILRVGIHGGHRNAPLKAIDIHPDVKPTALPKFEVEVGARVTYLHCRTVSDNRPTGEVKTCSCKFDRETLSAHPGACSP
nr:hypothetical protein [Rhodoferax sp.]